MDTPARPAQNVRTVRLVGFFSAATVDLGRLR